VRVDHPTIANVSGPREKESRRTIGDFFPKKTKAIWTRSCAQRSGFLHLWQR
jgi:hypothetical protein